MKSSPPDEALDVHLIAVGGTGMAPLACLLEGRGHRVRGSDRPLYPPMSTLLAGCGIEPLVGFDPAHLEPRPDLVVVGNAVPRDNPEALEAERLHAEGALERISMPQALWRFFLRERHRLVVAGTHGKTTTTAMTAWVWSACGADPSYLVGGLPKDLPQSFRDGGGDFLVEGDEYNAAYFDRGPKFLHYRPDTLILTSVEYDHADLYPSHDDLLAAYRELVESVPPEGLLVACGDSAELRELTRRARCRVVLYGLAAENDVAPEGEVAPGPEGSRLVVRDRSGAGTERTELRLAVPGRHNVSNALAVWVAARNRGLGSQAVAGALGRFSGVARRLEELGTAAGVTVVDDFAHHPTAVKESLAALGRRYPGRRLVALFEPRSLTAGRSFLKEAYARAFRESHRVLFAPPFYAERFEPEDRIDFHRLAQDLTKAGTEARAFDTHEDLQSQVLQQAQPGDVLVTMSSGSFDALPHKLLEALKGNRARS